MNIKNANERFDNWTKQYLPQFVHNYVKWVNVQSVTLVLWRLYITTSVMAFTAYLVHLASLFLKRVIPIVLVIAFTTHNTWAHAQAPPKILVLQKADIVAEITNPDGTGTLKMKDGRTFVTFRQYGEAFIVDTDGTVYKVDPNFTLCEVIFAIAIIGVAATAIYTVYKCARLLDKTNAPPTNAPPKSGGEEEGLAFFGKNGQKDYSSPFLSGFQRTLELPEGYILECDTNLPVDVMDVFPMGWKDWRGNIYTIQYGLNVPNMSAVASSNNAQLRCFLNSSQNLMDWSPETFSITGWISTATANYKSPQSNMVVVAYDCFGTPFKTNWYWFFENAKPNLKSSLGGLPKEDGIPQKYWRQNLAP